MSKSSFEEKDGLIYEKILGTRTSGNYFFLVTFSLGAVGFLIVGLSSFFGFSLVKFLNASNIVFFPQGLVMSFYGLFGLLFSIYQWFLVYFKVGEGYLRLVFYFNSVLNLIYLDKFYFRSN